MLDEYKKLYIENASLIPDWKNLSRNELCRKYLSTKDVNIKDSYVSAIILSFWHVMVKAYNKYPVKVLTEEDCYDCLVQSVLSALEMQPWNDPTQSIYNDEKGPEKAINNMLQHNIINMYVAYQRHKRVLSHNLISLDSFIDVNNSEDKCNLFSFIEDTKIPEIFSSLFWKELVVNYFNKKKYLTSFVLDMLLNEPDIIKVIDDKYVINSRKLVSLLNSEIDDTYLNIFSDNYDIDKNKVEQASRYVITANKKEVDRILTSLTNDIRSERGVFIDYQ